MENTKEFRERLTWLVAKSGMSGLRLSKELGFSASTVNNWLSGRSKRIPPANLKKLCNFFGVKLDLTPDIDVIGDGDFIKVTKNSGEPLYIKWSKLILIHKKDGDTCLILDLPVQECEIVVRETPEEIMESAGYGRKANGMVKKAVS